jgi:hypothetical protein
MFRYETEEDHRILDCYIFEVGLMYGASCD